MNKKVEWIAKQLPEYSADDIEDVISGNITQPTDFVSEILYCAAAYGMEMEKWSHKVNL